MDILLSIKPKYVAYIRTGKKLVELRKTFPINKDITRVFIYESSPVKKICGYINPTAIQRFAIAELWEKTKSLSCVEESDFKKYYQGKDSGTAIFFDCFIPLPVATLQQIAQRAPQSYTYLTPSQSAVLEVLIANSEF